MLSPPRRWIRDQPLSSGISSVRRLLCSRRHSLWILLILLVVCVAIQTFVARQARNEKLIGLPHLRFPVNKDNTFPTLQNGWADPDFESSLRGKQDIGSPQAHGTVNLHGQNEGPAEHGGLSKSSNQISNPATGSETNTKNALLGELLDAEPEDEPSVGLPGALFPHNAGKDMKSARNRILGAPSTPSTPSASGIVKSQISSAHSGASCRPRDHIVFLKTHKTASSTILNILYRYGESRNLTFALPLNKHSQLFYPFFFASHFVEGVNSRSVTEFHIMCNHMRFRKSEVAKVMPRDSFYFSILRHPVAMMESIFIYFKSIPAFQKTQSLDSFLDDSWRNYNPLATNNHYAHNILAFDFGLDNNVTAGSADLEEKAATAIESIGRDFDLILISEYFDESMILLKHALCWSMEDVASFRLNSRSERSRRSLSPETAEKIKWWNALDWRIYLHFNATFWHKVDTLVGRENMQREVSQLRELQVKLATACLKDGRAVDPSQVKDAGLKPFQYGAAVIQGYNLNPELDSQTSTKCQTLITPELQYTDRLYSRQFPEIAVRHRAGTKIAAPRHQRSGRTAVMGMMRQREAYQRQILRKTFPNPRHRKTTIALPTHKDFHKKTKMP